MTEMPHYLEIIAWLGLTFFVISFFLQGLMIASERNGYQQTPKIKSHPEIEEIRGTGVLLGVSFPRPTPELPELDEDDPYKVLQRRVYEKKIEELFEEPSTYEDDDDDDFGVAGIR